MKILSTLALVALEATALALGLLVFVAGYFWQAAALGAIAVAGLAAAAWASRSRPTARTEPREWLVWDEELEDGLSDVERQMLRYGFVGDPVDVHQAQMARALGGQR